MPAPVLLVSYGKVLTLSMKPSVGKVTKQEIPLLLSKWASNWTDNCLHNQSKQKGNSHQSRPGVTASHTGKRDSTASQPHPSPTRVRDFAHPQPDTGGQTSDTRSLLHFNVAYWICIKFMINFVCIVSHFIICEGVFSLYSFSDIYDIISIIYWQ